MFSSNPDTEELLRLASDGDETAAHQLLMDHRDRLKRMVAVRLDRRLATRLDPSDVVQETLLVAIQRLPEYCAQEHPMAFYPWLRRLAVDRLIDLHRRHIDRQRRSVNRELPNRLNLPDQFAAQLIDHFLVANETSASDRLLRKELRARVQTALHRLPEKYRELLVLRHLEQLSITETAEVLGISVSTAKSRYYRAVQRMHESLKEVPE